MSSRDRQEPPKASASVGDLAEKTVSFIEIAEGLCAPPAEDDPNSDVIVGDASSMVTEVQAPPCLTRMVIDCVRSVAAKFITRLALTHSHAVWVLGASAHRAPTLIPFGSVRAMVLENWDSEFARFPYLFHSRGGALAGTRFEESDPT